MTTPMPAGATPRLGPDVRRLFVGVALSALGSGLTLPFLYVYLNEVRDLPTTTVGLLFAWMGLVGLGASTAAGTLIDRHGPRRVIIGGLAVLSLGVALLTAVDSVGRAMAVLAIVSVGNAVMWPATTALLTRLVPEAARERVYGLQFVLLNAGLGLGGLVSAVIIRVDSLGSFQAVYLLDALTYLGYLAIVLGLPAGAGEPSAQEAPDPGTAPPGWREVLADRTLVRVALVSALLVTFGYAQFEAGFAAYAVDVAQVPPRALGLAFAANTAAIVLGQLVVLRWVRGRRRSRMLALAAVVWAGSWVVIALSAVVEPAVAVVLLVVGLGVFGLGETLWAPMAPAVVNALASESLRGRYNALFSMSWTVSMILGPAIAGLLLGNGLAWLWVLATVGGCLLGAWLMLGLRTRLTDAQDGLTAQVWGRRSTSPAP